MKKYIPVDFDEKGNVILGNAKTTPTSNGFIPTTWVPGGGSEDEGNGIKSITITPALETTPTLDSVMPFYYGERPANSLHLNVDVGANETYTVTVTVTNGWVAYCDDTESGASEPLSFTLATDGGGTITSGANFGAYDANDESEQRYVEVQFMTDK